MDGDGGGVQVAAASGEMKGLTKILPPKAGGAALTSGTSGSVLVTAGGDGDDGASVSGSRVAGTTIGN
jgi:hypothetical protein